MTSNFIFDKEKRRIIKGRVIIHLSCKEASLMAELIKSQITMRRLSYTEITHAVCENGANALIPTILRNWFLS